MNISRRTAPLILLLTAILCLGGCRGKGEGPADPREAETDRKVREKWGKSLDELPTVKLIAISPHNVDIEYEYAAAFSLHHAVEHGQKVQIEWKDVGGGGSAVLRYLRNVYANSDRSGIDVVWGGGEPNFRRMADEGILQAMTIAPDTLENIPAKFGGLDMYDAEHRWCGSAVSGFGFLYNKPLLERLNRRPPRQWEDLGDPRFFDLVGLADPTQSGSAATSYEMIVQSGDDWATGWAKLLSILGNAKKFYSGAGDAAEAVSSGEVAVSTCIDFYGFIRVAKYPETLIYVSPEGQTSFNPDPIGILKNPPHPELAQRLVDFVLSRRGQGLWALPAGDPDGPVRSALARQPIRKDVYEHYAGRLTPMVVNPYAAGQGMEIDTELWDVSYAVLQQLVWAAGVRNSDALREAKKKLIETNFPPGKLSKFNALPDNVATREVLPETAKLLTDKKQRDIIVTQWISFFRDKYERVAE